MRTKFLKYANTRTSDDAQRMTSISRNSPRQLTNASCASEEPPWMGGRKPFSIQIARLLRPPDDSRYKLKRIRIANRLTETIAMRAASCGGIGVSGPEQEHVRVHFHFANRAESARHLVGRLQGQNQRTDLQRVVFSFFRRQR